LRHEVSCLLKVKGVGGRIAAGDLFPTVVDGWRVPALEFKEFGVVEQGGASLETLSDW